MPVLVKNCIAHLNPHSKTVFILCAQSGCGVMASSWESFIAASTSAAPAHTSVSATPAAAAASPGGGPIITPAATLPQQSYNPSDPAHHQTPHHPPVTHYQQQPQHLHVGQPPHQGIRVNIPSQVGCGQNSFSIGFLLCLQ